MIPLDTNVISELIRAEPAPAVLSYVHRLAPEAIFTAAICGAEIRYGLARMPRGRKRDDLVDRISRFFDIGFREQILPFDRHCAIVYGEVRCSREAAGKPIAVEDAMIAATARANGALAIATRNVRDFADCGVPLIDPWVGS